MKHTLILATVIVGMISCNPGSSGDKTAPATISTPTAPATNSTAPAVTTPAGTNTTVTSPTTTTTTTANPAPAATSPATTNSGALNPAHGQPGHRCDIAVGAPLNSAPTDFKKSAGSTTPQTITTSPQTVTTSPQTVTPNIPSISTAPVISPSTSVSTTPATGLNPAHGQPGHRCDISVGAPLNSKPVSTTPALPTPTKQ